MINNNDLNLKLTLNHTFLVDEGEENSKLQVLFIWNNNYQYIFVMQSRFLEYNSKPT